MYYTPATIILTWSFISGNEPGLWLAVQGNGLLLTPTLKFEFIALETVVFIECNVFYNSNIFYLIVAFIFIP